MALALAYTPNMYNGIISVLDAEQLYIILFLATYCCFTFLYGLKVAEKAARKYVDGINKRRGKRE